MSHSYEAIGAGEALLSTLKDAETGQRGHLLIGEPTYLAPYSEAVTEIA